MAFLLIMLNSSSILFISCSSISSLAFCSSLLEFVSFYSLAFGISSSFSGSFKSSSIDSASFCFSLLELLSFYSPARRRRSSILNSSY